MKGKDYPETHPVYQTCMELALKNNLSYLDKKFALHEAEINEMLARDARKWDLRGGFGIKDIQGDATNAPDSRENEWKTYLKLNAPVNLWGDDLLARKRGLLSAQLTKRKAELELSKAKIDLQTKIANAVRNVNIRFKLIRLSQNDRDLKNRQLKNEQAKLMAGRSTNFQVVSYQDQLLEAERNEVSKVIAYVQSLTALDQILGTTMGTWDIEFKHDNKQLEKQFANEIRPLVWTWW